MKHGTWKVAAKGLLLLLAILISGSALAGAAQQTANETIGTGKTRITLMIVTSIYDFPTYYDLLTDESNLLDALLGVNLIEGDYASWGFEVTTVDGVTADAGEGEYWKITTHDIKEGYSKRKVGIESVLTKSIDMVIFELESPSFLTAEDVSDAEALAIENLATRSGPSTKYRETGSYNVKGEYVLLVSLAYDENDLCWVQCEVLSGNKLRRVYTGLKRFDTGSFDIRDVPVEYPMDALVKVLSTSRAMFGPGAGYDAYDSLTVDKGQTVNIITIENDYAQVEWTTTKQSYRAWVPVSTLNY